MDVLLIDPPYMSLKGVSTDCGYNVGLTGLAGYLRSQGIDSAILAGDLLTDLSDTKWNVYDFKVYASAQRDYAKIVDNKDHIVWKKISDIVKESNPLLVGISYYTPLKNAVERIVGLVKEVDPNIKIAVGAFHPTFCPDAVMKNPDVDFAVSGEGEIPLLNLAIEVKKDNPKWEMVPGIHYRDKDGQIHKNDIAPLIDNLDDLPFIARDLVMNCDYSVYRDHCLTSTRGCPYTCSFCGDKGLWRGKIRRRSVDNVIEELKFILGRYDVNFVDFMDGTFTYDKKYLRTLCNRMIDEQLTINWRCTARYDNLDEELMKLLKRANCVGFYFGLESGSARVLKAVDKRTTVEEIVRVDNMVHEYGFYSATSVLLGLPYETREDMRKTLDLMKKVKTNVFDVNSYIPLPGTILYNQMDSIERDNIDWRKVAMKSLDNYFSTKMPPEEFRGYLLEAYEIANIAWEKSFTSVNKQH